MTIDLINVGTSPNSGDGDTLRDAFIKVNSNFADVGEHLGNIENPHRVTAAQVGAVETGEKGAPNGVATLDANGKLSAAQKPTYSISELVGPIDGGQF